MPFIKPTREEVDCVAFRLLTTVDEPEVTREDLSEEDRYRIAAASLKHVRKVKGLTQRGLARQLGITEGYFQAIETGRRRPSLDLQAKLYAWFLKYGLEHFFFYCLALLVTL